MSRKPLELHTTRLLIRELNAADIADLAVILGDPQVMRYSVRGILNEKATGEFVKGSLDCYESDGFGPMAVIEKASSRLVGFCGLNAEQVDGVREVEIGYRLGTSFWGRGLASEAVQAVLQHGFVTLRIPSIIAIVQPENVASVNVLRKAGFSGFIHSQYHRLGVRIYRMELQQWLAGSS